MYRFPPAALLPSTQKRAQVMKNKVATWAVVSFGALLLVPALAWGQGFGGAGSRGYYRPSRPTLSPYLDYFRRDVGLTNQYYSFVRPYQQLSSTLNQQNAAISGLSRQVNQAGAAQGPLPTGTGSVFMNYSHYYPAARGAGR
jgi:hypothetical protein